MKDRDLTDDECSTPFGVEGSITLPLEHQLLDQVVLNAFRRRRFHHLRDLRDRTDGRLECSTPFGVEGSITERKEFDPSQLPECSTPFGVEGSITAVLGEHDAVQVA